MSYKNISGFFRIFFRSFSLSVLVQLLLDFILQDKMNIDHRWIVIALAGSLFSAYYTFTVFKKSDTRAVKALKITGLCVETSLVVYGIMLLYGFFGNMHRWVLIVIPVGLILWALLLAFLSLKFAAAAQRQAVDEINEMLKKNDNEGE